MNDNAKRNMVLDIVMEIDYDIFKECYDEGTAEEPEYVEGNIERLIAIVDKYLKG